MYIHVCPALYVNKGGKKTIQLYTKPYILLVTILIFSVLRNVGFVHQTLHKPSTELYIEPFSELYIEPFSELYIELFTERCTNPHVEVRKALPFREGLG